MIDVTVICIRGREEPTGLMIDVMHKRSRRADWPPADYWRLAFSSKRLTGVLPVWHESVHGGFQAHVRKSHAAKGS
jgi:hypothetical protein